MAQTHGYVLVIRNVCIEYVHENIAIQQATKYTILLSEWNITLWKREYDRSRIVMQRLAR